MMLAIAGAEATLVTEGSANQQAKLCRIRTPARDLGQKYEDQSATPHHMKSKTPHPEQDGGHDENAANYMYRT